MLLSGNAEILDQGVIVHRDRLCQNGCVRSSTALTARLRWPLLPPQPRWSACWLSALALMCAPLFSFTNKRVC